MPNIPAGPTAKALGKFKLTVCGVAKGLELGSRQAVSNFFNNEKYDGYLGKEKQRRLRLLLQLTPQQFAKFVNRVRAEHEALRSIPPVRDEDQPKRQGGLKG